MSFQYPWLLLLLLLAIPVWWLFLRATKLRQERLNRFADNALLKRLLKGDSQGIRNWRFVLTSGAMLIILFCASGPRIRGGKEIQQLSGLDIVFVIDVSNSMKAQDLQPNRLERTKLELIQLIEKSGNDRFGIVIFAGRAIPQLPLTNDKNSAVTILESISSYDIMRQGTNIEDALEMAELSFGEANNARGIILISDGEAHDGDAVNMAEKLYKDKNIIISTIGVGSTSGSSIPETDREGRITGDKADENGQPVITKLNEQLLEEIAEAGKGTYVHAGSSDFGLRTIYNNLSTLNKTTEYAERFTTYRTLVPWLLIGALLLLLIEVMLPTPKRD